MRVSLRSIPAHGRATKPRIASSMFVPRLTVPQALAGAVQHCTCLTVVTRSREEEQGRKGEGGGIVCNVVWVYETAAERLTSQDCQCAMCVLQRMHRTAAGAAAPANRARMLARSAAASFVCPSTGGKSRSTPTNSSASAAVLSECRDAAARR